MLLSNNKKLFEILGHFYEHKVHEHYLHNNK